MNNIYKIIEDELTDYESKSVEISPGVHRSAYKRIKRIAFFENQGGEDNKIDELGQYSYWLRPEKTHIDSTVKNLRVDTKNFLVFSVNPIGDFPLVFTTNCALRDTMFNADRDIQLKEDVEAYVGWGNCLWRKLQDGFELCDLSNTFVINQKAKTVNDSTIIERHELTQSQLRAFEGVYKNIEEVIKSCGDKTFKATRNTTTEESTNPIYEIYVRVGELSEKALFMAQGKEGGSEDKFLLAKVVVAGLEKNKSDEKLTLFAEPLGKKVQSDLYKEAHLGPYKGTWLREGLYEIFFDYILAIREIDNDIQEGLEWASKVIFRASDNKVLQNVRTDIENGRLVTSKDLMQVDVRLQNLDQLISRRNNLIEEMNAISHSFEVVQGATPASGVPLGTTLQMNENAGKHFIGIRQKITIPYKHIYQEWELPRIIKSLSTQDIIRLTGDQNVLEQFRKMVVDSWYMQNLAKIGPHTREMADEIKAEKMKEMMDYDALVKNIPELWKGVAKRLYITVTGENMDIAGNVSTISALIQFETDPVRRAYLLDMLYAIKNIPVPPPVNPELVQQQVQGQQENPVKNNE